MGVPSIKISRSFGDVAVIEPVANKYSIAQYEKLRITKNGYLHGFYTVRLVEDFHNKQVSENIGLIGKGYLIESATDLKIVVKKPKKGRVLVNEVYRDKKTMLWGKEKLPDATK